MCGSSKLDISDFRSERESLDALIVGRASMITIETWHITHIPFQTIVASKRFENHIDDCVQLAV